LQILGGAHGRGREAEKNNGYAAPR